jgi:fumarate reductase subunit C
MNVRLYAFQRLTAALMVPLVLVHVVVIFYASRAGLTAADILARTRGSVAWAGFYALFVLAAAAHGSIGLRTVAMEWLGWRASAADRLMWAIALALAALGMQAIYAVVRP